MPFQISVDRRQYLLSVGISGLSFCTPFASPALAAQVDRAEFPESYRVGKLLLKLRGAGIGYYRSLVKGLAAGLYLDQRARPEDVLGDVAKRIEIEYFWSLTGATITAALGRSLNDNVEPAALAAIQSHVDRVHSAMGDVRAGDRVALTYVPGTGTWLTHNGETIATVAGRDFPAAYFSLWFGKQPMDARLKRVLLGIS